MRDMLSRVGQPQVTKTTMTPPKQNLDIGTLIAMLAMMGDQFGGKDQPCDAAHPCQAPKLCVGGKCIDPEKYSGSETDNPWGQDLGAESGGGFGGGAANGITPALLMQLISGMTGR
jgi:hypothetical protein